MRKLIDMRPVTKATTEPRRRDEPKPVTNNSCRTSKSFFRPAPKSIGSDRRKLNRTASS